MSHIDLIFTLVGGFGVVLGLVAIVLVYKVRVFDIEKIVNSMNYRIEGKRLTLSTAPVEQEAGRERSVKIHAF